MRLLLARTFVRDCYAYIQYRDQRPWRRLQLRTDEDFHYSRQEPGAYSESDVITLKKDFLLHPSHSYYIWTNREGWSNARIEIQVTSLK